MQNLTNTISEVLSDELPQHLVKLITPKLVKAIERSENREERQETYKGTEDAYDEVAS